MSPSRKLLAIFSLVVALCLGAGFAAGELVRSPAQVAADADPPPPSVLTSPVTKGSVTRAIVVRGSVRPGASVSIDAVAPEGMDPVVTRQPLHVGQILRPGMVVTEVSYRPIIVLAGDIPMVRDLSAGSTGPDVSELQQSIESLGWGIYDTPGVFGPSTAAALTNLYRSVGYVVPTQPAAVEPTGDGGTDDDGKSDGKTADKAVAPTDPPDVVVARKSELVVLARLPGTVAAAPAKVGAVAGEAVLTVSTAPPTIRASVSPSQRSLVREGDPVTLISASPQFRSRARITHVGATVQDEQSKAFSVPLTITPSKSLPDGTLEKGIEVRINVKKAAAAGMIVPITAIYTTADGATAVVKVTQAGTESIEVTVVETGSGRALIQPETVGELATGDQVRVGATG